MESKNARRIGAFSWLKWVASLEAFGEGHLQSSRSLVIMLHTQVSHRLFNSKRCFTVFYFDIHDLCIKYHVVFNHVVNISPIPSRPQRWAARWDVKDLICLGVQATICNSLRI